MRSDADLLGTGDVIEPDIVKYPVARPAMLFDTDSQPWTLRHSKRMLGLVVMVVMLIVAASGIGAANAAPAEASATSPVADEVPKPTRAKAAQWHSDATPSAVSAPRCQDEPGISALNRCGALDQGPIHALVGGLPPPLRGPPRS